MRARWHRSTRREEYTVDVTAFLSLLVILVPFLLVTAVFSRITILELQPAVSEADQASSPDPLQLKVILRQGEIEVTYLGLAQPLKIGRSTDERALELLATMAGDLKARYPQSLEATVLLEPQIRYDLLVQVLDALRIRLQQHEGGVEQIALFPMIALGSASVMAAPGRGAP